MLPSGTHINYYLLCKRKLWLFSHNIQCEQDSDAVLQGKVLHENSYQRENKEYQFGPIKIDWLDLKNKVVHEVKKSDKMEDAHLWQLKYYLYYLKHNGVGEFRGELDYPKLKKKLPVNLAETDEIEIQEIIINIHDICNIELPPEPLIGKSFCKNCSYYELCFI
ncbi:MAG: CRISPR-associated protein Cas4 [Candidatus Kapabacteria bacterium]|nr:CRISPR-associated protein Cas4 [Candidatus Kapabacteria bacterium]